MSFGLFVMRGGLFFNAVGMKKLYFRPIFYAMGPVSQNRNAMSQWTQVFSQVFRGQTLNKFLATMFETVGD